MKLLIAYDGSNCSESALDDLVRAGLPETGEALVVSVAEVWLPPPNGNKNPSEIRLDPYYENLIKKHYERGKKALAEAETFAIHAKNRVKKILPGWKVGAASTYGSPAWEILTRADEFEPDLIVVGSHGCSTICRLVGHRMLGSISQKVLTEAGCSVRIARGKIEVDPAPARILIGFDGSKGANAAVEAVSRRKWLDESEVRLVVVADPATPSAIGRFIPPVTHMVEEVNQTERIWMERLAENALIQLRGAGLTASLHIHDGNPKKVLAETAEAWNADCIFVGANAFGSKMERFLIGSTSAAVAARASCSVEVVRSKS